MKVKFYLGIIVSLIIVVVFFFLLSNIKPPTSVPKTTFFPTPTPVPQIITTTQNSLHVIGVFPPDKASGISSDQDITITFSKLISGGEMNFFSFPEIRASLSAQENVLRVAPQEPLTLGVVYSYSIFDNTTGEFIFQGTFTTGNPSSSILPLQDANVNLEESAADFQRQNHPDVYLSNNVPYQTRSFQVTDSFIDNPTGHYAFFITTTDTLGKTKFINWLHALGITNSQIQQLDIRYQ